MANIDLTLNAFKIGNMPSFNNAFGTKQTSPGKGCTTAENTLNMMLPFLRMRPLVLTENSATSEVQADAVLNLSGAVTSLTLGSGAYKGVEVKIINDADGDVELLNGSKIITANLGETLELRWNGTEWRVKCAKQPGDFLIQWQGEKSPLEKHLEGEWVIWSGRAVKYGISETAPPESVNYYTLAGTTIAAGQTPVVLYHIDGSDYQLFRFKVSTEAYVVPAELDPVKWNLLEPDVYDFRESCQKLAVRDPVTREITATGDLQIGDQITGGPHAGKYITEVIVPGGKFPSIEGGFRPTMDLSWIKDLSPLVILELIFGIIVFVLLAKHTGLSISKKGLRFKGAENISAILRTVETIKESDVRQEEKLDKLSGTVENNVKDIVRLSFYNTQLSPAERLVAGKRYLDAGGNGETQKAIRDLADHYPDIWAGIEMVI
ncbi:MAG: hypothetical protein LBF77_08340, partial [Spirochaetaceae bacterium]|nr:hypothetical protein [Spirochaetaceae bacterium]